MVLILLGVPPQQNLFSLAWGFMRERFLMEATNGLPRYFVHFCDVLMLADI